jgi:hypothetical protein
MRRCAYARGTIIYIKNRRSAAKNLIDVHPRNGKQYNILTTACKNRLLKYTYRYYNNRILLDFRSVIVL